MSTSSPRNIAILGAGQAGLQAAASLRQLGCDAAITLVGDEHHLPYQRPPLSKAFLKGEVTTDGLRLRPEEFFTANAIGLALGSKVEEIDRHGRQLNFERGESIAFDRLIIATGVRPRSLPIAGADLPGVHMLRSIGDTQKLAGDLEQGNAIVIIGGGFIGLEVAAVAAGMGKSVTLVENQDRLMARAVAPATSAFFGAMHRDLGIDIRLQASVAKIYGEQRVESVALSDGTIIDCDVVLIGAGAIPNSELAAAAGLESPNGILVDEFGRTGDEGIYAVGDCSLHPNRFAGGLFRLESVQNAIDQAKAAALSIVGTAKPYEATPWFWSDQGKVKLQTTGLPIGADEHVVRGNPDDGRFSVFHLRGGAVIAVDSISSPAEHMFARKAVSSSLSIPSEQLADLDVDLKRLVA